ncbi:MAG TPA: response regulator transcription factor [Clostridia bacterium]|nr:response regulator transcription factor [Clostridia bacterium]
MASRKILAVDDEPDIIKIVDHRLSREGYEVISACDGEEAIDKFRREKPDLVILDLMLPKVDGFEVCRMMREESDVPIIILSARGDELDRLLGFRMGGDDYLTKPFSPSELALRVQAMLRRSGGRKTEEEEPPNTIRANGLYIDLRGHLVMLNDEEVQLTPKEFKLLWLLASHPDYVFTREHLLDQIWDSDYMGDADNVTVMVSRLREKIEKDASNPKYIKTVWGVGYKFGGDILRRGSSGTE